MRVGGGPSIPPAAFSPEFMKFVFQQFLRHIVPGVIRPLRIVWNEIIGFIFLVFALVPIPRTWRTWNEYDRTGEGLFNVLLSVVFITIMASFAYGSFRRARKIART